MAGNVPVMNVMVPDGLVVSFNDNGSISTAKMPSLLYVNGRSKPFLMIWKFLLKTYAKIHVFYALLCVFSRLALQVNTNKKQVQAPKPQQPTKSSLTIAANPIQHNNDSNKNTSKKEK